MKVAFYTRKTPFLNTPPSFNRCSKEQAKYLKMRTSTLKFICTLVSFFFFTVTSSNLPAQERQPGDLFIEITGKELNEAAQKAGIHSDLPDDLVIYRLKDTRIGISSRNPGEVLLDSTIHSNYFPDAAQWAYTSRINYAYNEQNQISAEVIQQWNGYVGLWENAQKNRFTYDSNGIVIEEIINTPRDTGWHPILRDVHHYDDQLRHTSTIRMRNYAYEAIDWRLFEKDSTTYNENGDVQYETNYTFGVFTEVWEPVERTVYSYSNGAISEIRDQVWEANTWVNTLRQLIEDRPSEKTQVYQVWDTDLQNWVNNSQSITHYSQNKLEAETITMIWDGAEWQTSYMDSSVYHPDGYLVSTTGYHWDTLQQVWIKSYHLRYTHTPDGMLTSRRVWLLSSFTYDWTGYLRVLSTYDEQDSIIEQVGQIMSDDSVTWLNSDRVIWAYDDAGRLTRYAYSYWDELNLAWEIDREETWAYDNAGNLLEHFELFTLGDCTLKVREVFEYSETNKVIFYESESFDCINEIWIPMTQSVYTYDDTDDLISKEVLRGTFENGWENDSLIFYTYRDGKIEMEIRQTWENQWVNSNRIMYTYDMEGRILRIERQLWDGVWTNERRTEYTYEDGGRKVEWIESFSQNEIWVPGQKSIRAWDQEGRLILTREYEYIPVEKMWLLTEEEIWAYDNFGNLTLESSFKSSPYYESGRKTIYVFDESGNCTYETWYEWDMEMQDWVCKDRSTFTYDSSGYMIKVLYQQWDADYGKWIDRQRTFVTNDALGNMLDGVSEAFDRYGFWKKEMRLSIELDAHGNSLVQTLSLWSPVGLGWHDVFYYENFYSVHATTSTPLLTENRIHCIYPNPFNAKTDQIRCTCEQDAELEYRLHTQSGQLIYQSEGTSGIAFKTHLPQGAYFLFVLDKENRAVHRGKLIVIDP